MPRAITVHSPAHDKCFAKCAHDGGLSCLRIACLCFFSSLAASRRARSFRPAVRKPWLRIVRRRHAARGVVCRARLSEELSRREPVVLAAHARHRARVRAFGGPLDVLGRGRFSGVPRNGPLTEAGYTVRTHERISRKLSLVTGRILTWPGQHAQHPDSFLAPQRDQSGQAGRELTKVRRPFFDLLSSRRFVPMRRMPHSDEPLALRIANRGLRSFAFDVRSRSLCMARRTAGIRQWQLSRRSSCT